MSYKQREACIVIMRTALDKLQFEPSFPNLPGMGSKLTSRVHHYWCVKAAFIQKWPTAELEKTLLGLRQLNSTV